MDAVKSVASIGSRISFVVVSRQKLYEWPDLYTFTDSDEDGPAATLAMKRAASAARAGKKNKSVKENSR